MPNPQPPIDPPGAVSPDFVATALDKLRMRLLDLTLSNRLLHFRHTRKSSLRVVDELPDALWNRLQDGDELVFVPVPEPPPDVVIKEPGPSKPDGSAGEPVERRPTPREHAATLGLATSFDLPDAPVGDDKPKAAHRDKQIQTIHFPDELEAILRTIANSSRSAIEETGSNMLFLVVGFLEWYESPSSATPLFAPLLTLPVSMRRGDVDPKTRTFRYFVSYSGEDAGFNASLHEKLRRDFGVSLPSLEDGESPEAYFARVRTAIAELDKWTVRRQVTVSLLSFGKLLMYQDLDPARWPAGREPSSHPRVRELLAGVDRPAGQVSREYELDADDLQAELPPIVMDADSSQHSALVDAMRGRNLVIQGPPGTGKSQTIANLIAAAMLAGKTVLFVSEKLAALEVVRRRLDAAGLGAFCLELHSHKTQKQELLKDIARRLEARGSFPDPQDLDSKVDVLRQSRARLSDYIHELHAPFGAAQRSAFDLVWASERSRTELGQLASTAEEAAFPDAATWSLADFEQCREQLGSFADHLAATRAVAGAETHPWAGLTRPPANADDEKLLVRDVAAVASLAELVCQPVQSLRDASGLSLDDTRPALDVFVGAVRAISLIEPEHAAILPRVANDADRESLTAFAERLERWTAAGAAIAGKLSRVPDAGEFESIKAAASSLTRIVSGTLSEADGAARRLEAIPSRLASYEALLAQVSSALGAALPSSLQGAAAALECVAVARSAPFSSLHLRNPSRDPEQDEHVYRAAIAEAQAIWQAGTSLSPRFELSLLPDPASLTRHLGACATAGPLKFLDAAYQAAERCFASLSKAGRDAPPEEMAKAFQQLASYASRIAAFNQNAEYRAAIGPAFRGTGTPFQELTAVRAWQMRAPQAIAALCPGAPETARRLVSAPPEAIRHLASLVPDVDSLRAELRSTAELTAAPQAPLAEAARGAGERAKAMRAAASALSTAGFAPSCEVPQLEAITDAAATYLGLYRALHADDAARAILGAAFAGSATRAELIRGILAADAALARSTLPPAWTAWIRQDGAVRVRALREAADRIAQSVQALDVAHATFAQHAGLEPRLWYQRPASWSDGVGGADVAARASRAQAASEQLASWCGLLRAKEQLARAGLAFLADLAEGGSVSPELLWPFCEYGLTRGLARSAVAGRPVLASFEGSAHTQARDRFRRYDADVIQTFRARAASRVDQRPVPEGVRTGPIASHTELALLEHECRKQRRHLPIRQLVRRAGKALQAIKPCFMMGPRSVAQYLEPGALEFDLLVTDEASQLRPEDAFGALCRAGQAAIIGDPLQLPPTAFFDRMNDDEEIDEAEQTPVDESESILDVAAAAWAPIRRLRWHYRSRHESLIAFSNVEFYERQLVVFPAPAPLSDDLGVRFELVPDGVYAAVRNDREVQRVVDALVEHLREHPGESVGVATMNFKQRDLIDEELQRRAKDDAPLREAIDRATASPEPLFVKNLENVQGDERDVILVSVTYGKDASGKLYQRFGPLNGAAGPRRLNVLFTRARRRIAVFCSFDPEELVGVDSASRDGAGVLKRYLAFAKARSASRTQAGQGASAQFEQAMSLALRARGLQTATRVGVDGSVIDVAVVHPDQPDAYILGIECDGSVYRAAFSARDRDRLRQNALESMGWAVHRVWTAEWFRDRARVIEAIVQRVEALRARAT